MNGEGRRERLAGGQGRGYDKTILTYFPRTDIDNLRNNITIMRIYISSNRLKSLSVGLIDMARAFWRLSSLIQAEWPVKDGLWEVSPR